MLARCTQLAKNPPKYPSDIFESAPLHRLRPGSGPFESIEEFWAAHECVGVVETANGDIIAQINPDWLASVEPLAPKKRLDGEAIARLERVLCNYKWARAGELAQVSWPDVIDAAQKIKDAAKGLLDAVNVSSEAQSIVVNLIKAAEPYPFSRDTYYPQVTQLVAHSARVLKELEAFKASGATLPTTAWRDFVIWNARIYADLGGKVTVSSISRANEGMHGKGKPSPFAEFAHALMLAVPAKLRQHAHTGEGSIRTFSESLKKELGELRRLGILSAN